MIHPHVSPALPHPAIADLRALESSILSKLKDRENWGACRASLTDELRMIRADLAEVRFWTDTSTQENS